MKKLNSLQVAKFVIVLQLVVLQLSAQIQSKKSVRTKSISQAEYIRWKNYSLKNDVYVSAYTGFGTYSMSGLKSFQSDIVRQIGVDARVNSNFPAYWLSGLIAMQKYDDARIGLNFGKMSTGARSSVSDYSGQFYSDFICEGYKLGFIFEKDLNYSIQFAGKLQTGYRLELGGLYSNIRNKIYTLVYDTPNGLIDEWITLESATYYIEPSLYVAYPISNKTSVRLSAGAMLDIPVEFRILIDEAWSDKRISWSGFRLNFSIVHQL